MKNSVLKSIVTALFAIIFNSSIAQMEVIGFIDFETASPFLVDIDSGGSWQTGQPSKLLFDSAHSFSRAILTDTLSPYPVNDTSSFVLRFPIPDNTWDPIELYFSFWHKFNTDTLQDRGLIEVSYNNGTTWYELTNYQSDTLVTGTYTQGYWNSSNVVNDTLRISGNSHNGWNHSVFNWELCFVVKQEITGWQPLDTIQFRFTFISDSIQTGKEGWMIDDIELSGFFAECCCGFGELQKPDFKICPNPANGLTSIYFEQRVNNMKLKLISSTGQTVYEKEFGSCNSISEDFSAYTPGIYIVETTHDNIISRAKLIIQ